MQSETKCYVLSTQYTEFVELGGLGGLGAVPRTKESMVLREHIGARRQYERGYKLAVNKVLVLPFSSFSRKPCLSESGLQVLITLAWSSE